MADRHSLDLAVRIGWPTGIRTLSALSVVSRHLSGRPAKGAGRAETLLSSGAARAVLALASVGELAADKVPGIPPRTKAWPLIGRAASAALAAAAVARSRGAPRVLGAVCSAGVAICSAVLATRTRALINRRLGVPDFVLGLAEDALVMAGLRGLAAGLDRVA